MRIVVSKANQNTNSHSSENNGTQGNKRPTKKRKVAVPKQTTTENKTQEEGYNSDDEHKKTTTLTREQLIALDLQLRNYVKEKGFNIVDMKEDGNCMFRAIAHQIYGDAEMHDQIRKLCMDYMQAERDHYSQYVTEDFSEYINRKRQIGCFGNSLELQAIAEMFSRPVEVYSSGKEPLNIFHDEFKSDAPIRVSYHNNNHYNSVVDPNFSNFGVGLGLPDLTPAPIEANQVGKAIEASENEVLEQVILDSEKELFDSMDTESEIEQAILQQSKQEYWAQIIQSTLAKLSPGSE